MAQGDRAARVAEQVQREVARILLEEAADPVLRGATVTAVRVSRDLRHARVLYAAHPDQRADVERRMARFEPFVQRQLAQRLRLRFAMVLSLRYDDGLEGAMRVGRILAEIGADHDAGGAAGPGPGGEETPRPADEGPAPGSGAVPAREDDEES